MYRLEIFENELKKTLTGKEILKVISRHFDEVIQLINYDREVLVTWKRNKGAEFFSRIIGSGLDAGIYVKKEIDSIKLTSLIRRMASILQERGSPALAKEIDKHLLVVVDYSTSCDSLEDVFKKIRQYEAVKTSKT